ITRRIREQPKHATALLVEFKYGVDNDYETGANMKMATASVPHGINIVFRRESTFFQSFPTITTSNTTQI
ncbi:hypothetical protein WN55_06954, partial [Dufourea novaeangliae]